MRQFAHLDIKELKVKIKVIIIGIALIKTWKLKNSLNCTITESGNTNEDTVQIICVVCCDF